MHLAPEASALSPELRERIGWTANGGLSPTVW